MCLSHSRGAIDGMILRNNRSTQTKSSNGACSCTSNPRWSALLVTPELPDMNHITNRLCYGTAITCMLLQLRSHAQNTSRVFNAKSHLQFLPELLCNEMYIKCNATFHSLEEKRVAMTNFILYFAFYLYLLLLLVPLLLDFSSLCSFFATLIA
jgi:hypothetical protein